MKPKRILIVEDDGKSRYALHSVLQERGYDVAATATAEEAAILDDHPYDAAVIDIRLPDRQGPDFARELRARHPHTRIIFVTAYHDRDVDEELIPGAVLLIKPIQMDVLCKLF